MLSDLPFSILSIVCNTDELEHAAFMSLRKLAGWAGATVLLLLATLLPIDVLAANGPVPSASVWQTSIADGDRNLSLQKLLLAENCYRKALTEVERGPHTDEDVVTCLQKVASTLALEDKTNEALHLYQRSLNILERRYGKDSPQLVPTLFALGSIFESEGDPKLAMTLYRRALAINEKNYGPFSPAVASNLHRLGRAECNAGNVEEAEHNYRSSLAILEQQPGLKSSDQLENLLADYSDLLRKTDTSNRDLIADFQKEILNDRTDSAALMKNQRSSWQQEMAAQSENTTKAQTNEAPQVALRAFKEPLSNPTLQPAYNTMADVLFKRAPSKNEEERYERMIAIDIKALGPDHPTVADDLNGLALLYLSQGRYAEAKTLLIRALGIYESVYGNDNLLVTSTRATLAATCNSLGQPNQATALYNTALSQGGQILAPNSFETARLLNEIAYLYYRQGRLEDARTTYQWALASTEAAAGKDSRLVAACLNDYANVLRSLGRTDEADQLQARSIRILATTTPTPLQ